MHGGIVLVGLLHNSRVFCADGKRYVLVRFGFPIRKHFFTWLIGHLQYNLNKIQNNFLSDSELKLFDRKFVFFKKYFVRIRNIFGKSGKEGPIRNQKCDYKKVSYKNHIIW